MNKGNNKKVSRYAANAFFWIIIVAFFKWFERSCDFRYNFACK